MIKKTLYFGNPAYLSLRNKQLVIKLPEVVKNDMLPENFKADAKKTIAVEDLGVVILDNKRITITHGLMDSLLENNCALITCDTRRMPVGLMLPLTGNTMQTERFQCQIDASAPLKKQLWQQTVKAKIENQAFVLANQSKVIEKNMLTCWSAHVKSGDPDNYDARAAVYYWSNIFPGIKGFTRRRDGVPPNNLLNCGYALLRAVVARSLVASGILPTLGIHPRNKNNAYSLADNIMEPYRPFVDKLVLEIVESGSDVSKLSHEIKAQLLHIPEIVVSINEQRSPLMVAVEQTTASLYKCFSGELGKIKYPSFY